ncbi:MAG: ankyrin repeat domain-containing protein [Wolbachia endosymbiont of Fragariocoptes setiger]|nr:ankyrin repeat domain-containing protein [Wolbachia endosymbiont of Fragariocoptes setiger]
MKKNLSVKHRSNPLSIKKSISKKHKSIDKMKQILLQEKVNAIDFLNQIETANIKSKKELFQSEAYFTQQTDYEYDLIVDGHLSQFINSDRSEILKKWGCSEDDIPEDTWYDYTDQVFEDIEPTNVSPSLMDHGYSLSQKIDKWLLQDCNLTEKQKALNQELLENLKYLDYYDEHAPYACDNGSFDILQLFLQENQNNPDLKIVLNLQRGESNSTVLHAISSANIPEEGIINLLIKAGSNINDQDSQGDTPLHYAAFVGNKKNVLSLLEMGADSTISNNEGKTSWQAASGNYCCDVKQTSALWKNLSHSQQEKLAAYLYKIAEAKDISELEKVVNDAIQDRMQLNYRPLVKGEVLNSFTDSIVLKIRDLGVIDEQGVISKTLGKLIGRGGVFSNQESMNVIAELESGCIIHKDCVKIAYKYYVNNAHQFIESAKNATNGKLNDLKIDNSNVYLEYSENGTVDMKKIVNEEVSHARNIIKIGASTEVEVEVNNGNRNYVNVSGRAVLSFNTEKGELQVTMYASEENDRHIVVKVNNQDLLNEKINEDCTLGGLSVVEAIKQGYFTKPLNINQEVEAKWQNSVQKSRETVKIAR